MYLCELHQRLVLTFFCFIQCFRVFPLRSDTFVKLTCLTTNLFKCSSIVFCQAKAVQFGFNQSGLIEQATLIPSFCLCCLLFAVIVHCHSNTSCHWSKGEQWLKTQSTAAHGKATQTQLNLYV